jgi:NAD-dependent dihydropyrimidine dehydrogenase PreA subunit
VTQDIYRTLAKHLDDLPGGFPATETGVELRILRRLFTPEEAEFALHVTLIPEEARVIARRAKMTTEAARSRLEDLTEKGLIFRLEPKNGQPQYGAAQFVIGIWEFQVNRLNPGLIEDAHEYAPTLFGESWKIPQLRTIPVGRSIENELRVMTHERGEEIVAAAEKIVVAPCICRRERKMVGEGCDRREEACLSFDMAADYYQSYGLGRPIERREALEILERADEEGLVLQPGGSRETLNICACCGCCCGVLRSFKRHPQPASSASTPFRAVVEPDACSGCDLCEDRCQMEAVRVEDGAAVVDLDRCVGCGLCVSTCPTGSLSLARKPDSEQPKLPKDAIRAAIKLGRARGKLSLGNMAMMQVRSKIDRLLASK